jgi:hypothetical protein
LQLRQIVFLAWVTLTEQKWVILERRRLEMQFTVSLRRLERAKAGTRIEIVVAMFDGRFSSSVWRKQMQRKFRQDDTSLQNAS